MEIEITVNTDDAKIASNIYVNSRRSLPWVVRQPENDGHAVIVGGGPSVADCLDEIRWRAANGQTVFALNNSALYLAQHGINVQRQVICDAREHNAKFVVWAEEYLFASQCHPSVFDAAAGAAVTVWHAADDDIEKMESLFPSDYPAYAMITGGTTVGLSAMTLAYALGYRKLHLYGYDSSHSKGARHAYPQQENNSIAECQMTVFGRTFDTSIAMAHQAEVFPQMCDILIDNGCLITVHGDGLIPWIVRELPKQTKNSPMAEADKYRAMWSLPAYRDHSPGEGLAERFCEIVKPSGHIVDFGCGSGRGGAAIQQKTGCVTTLVDFAENALDQEVKERLNGVLRFREYDLTERILLKGDFGFCADVMEHLPTESVDAVIKNIMEVCPKVFFQICCVPDAMGSLIGQRLHLTVMPFEWWREELGKYGRIEFEEDQGHNAIFYVSSSTT